MKCTVETYERPVNIHDRQAAIMILSAYACKQQ